MHRNPSKANNFITQNLNFKLNQILHDTSWLGEGAQSWDSHLSPDSPPFCGSRSRHTTAGTCSTLKVNFCLPLRVVWTPVSASWEQEPRIKVGCPVTGDHLTNMPLPLFVVLNAFLSNQAQLESTANTRQRQTVELLPFSIYGLI